VRAGSLNAGGRDRNRRGYLARSISKQANIGQRSVKVIMAAIDISNRRCRQFVGIDVVEQCNPDCVDNAAHHFTLTTRRRANATNPAKVKLSRRPGSPRRRPLLVRLERERLQDTPKVR
jgi:hypothetical protein